MSFFPTFDAIVSRLGESGHKASDSTRVVVSLGLLKHLIKLALRAEPFSKEYYLAYHTDLREGYEKGLLKDLHGHFINAGYFEGRRGSALDFDYKWYRSAYSDLRRQYSEQDEAKLRQHYLEQGKSEWRAPNEKAVESIMAWLAALDRDR